TVRVQAKHAFQKQEHLAWLFQETDELAIGLELETRGYRTGVTVERQDAVVAEGDVGSAITLERENDGFLISCTRCEYAAVGRDHNGVNELSRLTFNDAVAAKCRVERTIGVVPDNAILRQVIVRG